MNKIRKSIIFSTLLFLSISLLNAEISDSTKNELNGVYQTYVNALSNSDKETQRSVLCKKDLATFDKTSIFYPVIRLINFFTGGYKTEPITEFQEIDANTIEASNVAMNPVNFPNSNNRGKVTFVKENNAWKGCDLRH